MTEQNECDRLKAGDQKVVEQLFRQHYAYVTGFLVYREHIDKESASDAYTDAVLLFAQLVRDGRADCRNTRAFILKTALNTIRQERRIVKKVKPELLGDLFLDFFLHQSQQFSDPLAENEEQETLQQQILSFESAWQKISDRCRELLTKKVYEGIKNADLALQFNLKNNDVVVQAIAQCKESLKKGIKL